MNRGADAEAMPPPRPAHLRRLTLNHFRNLGVQELSFPPGGVAIIGDNAQGKSNLLEAIHYLETFRSFRGARDDQLITFGESVFRVAGTFDRVGGDGLGDDGRGDDRLGDDRLGEDDLGERFPGDAGVEEISAAYDREGKRKKVVLDGSEPERLGDAIGRAAIVTFSPSDVAIVSEGPAERRRFLDIVLSLNRPGYLAALQRFRSVLNQRNAALRANAPAAAVHAWDAGLVGAGSVVIGERRRWIERWQGPFSEYYAAIGGGQGAAMRYAPSVAPEAAETGAAEAEAAEAEAAQREAAQPRAAEPKAAEPDDDAVGRARTWPGVESAFREALAGSTDRERRLGSTVVGPHRDEVVFTVEGDAGGKTVRDFGSGGQRRTAALCLRLVEAATVRAARGREPIILMDDVFAELDVGRSERVLAVIDREETGQVILTAPKEADVRVRGGDLPRWRIAGGVISTG